MSRPFLVMVLTLLVAAPAAMAGTRADILRDCADDGRLDGSYTPSEIRDARNHIPADQDEYSDCRDVLNRALGGTGDKRLDDRSGGGPLGGGGGSGSSEPLTPSGPDEQAALDAAIGGGNRPVQVGDGTIVPGAAGLASGAARNDMPVTLLAVLIMLGLAALASAVPFVRRRVLARRLA